MDVPVQQKGFRARLGSAFSGKKKSTGKLRKAPPSDHPTSLYTVSTTSSRSDGALRSQEPWTMAASRLVSKGYAVDKQTGERRDDTAMLHGLAHRGSFDSFTMPIRKVKDTRPSGDVWIKRIPGDVWDMIIDYLNPCDAANLAFASKAMLRRIGYKPWSRLDRLENRQHRLDFLIPMDAHMPYHLFCFQCASYHFRIQPGNERLKLPDVINPIFDCPLAKDPTKKAPRARITPARNLPFTFLQLCLRASRYLPEYGVTSDSLSRRWTEQGGWSHQTRYLIHEGRLLVRVISSAFAQPGLPASAQRLLLFSRGDYSPYFSCCAHWRDGELLNLCKCALEHIPIPRTTEGPQGLANKVQDRLNGMHYNPNEIVSLCGKCQPMRRCPWCPSEYLIEIRLVEDKESKMFRRAIVVTRWSDLGDETMSKEWKACMGELDDYDSFMEVGKRAVSGTFEAAYTEEHIPGQRMLSLNPMRKKLAEDADTWY